MSRSEDANPEGARFLAALFADLPPGAYVQVWAIHPHEEGPITGERKTARRAFRNIARVDWQWARRLNGEGFGIYVACCSYAHASGRLKQDVSHLHALWSDLDEKSHLGGKAGIRATMRERLPAHLWPSALVDSGHGLHAWWFLAESVPVVARADGTREAEEYLAGLKILLGGDHVQDVSRVLRLPGFLNTKDPGRPVPVALVEWTPGRRFRLTDFERDRTDRRATREAGPRAGAPFRWLKLVAQHDGVRAVWEGRAGDHPDQSGSGKDMRLAHLARRYGFTPDEVTAILAHAPYPKRGGRTPDYLRRTVERAFTNEGKRSRPSAGFGQLPAWVVTSGTWARLSSRAKAVLGVLVVRAERPSFIVRVSMKRIAAEARVSVDRVGETTTELAEAGIIRKAHAPGGRWNTWLQMSPPPTLSAGSAEHVTQEATTGDPGFPTPAPPPSSIPGTCANRGPHAAETAESVNQHHSAESAEHVLSDHEWREGPGPSPPPGRSSVSVGVEAGSAGKARASMRLDSEMTPEGWKRVYQVQADGSRKLVWEGGISDWLNWKPPESLRDAVAQDGAALVKTDPDRRCEATTRARLACVGRPVVGSRFCKRHQTRRETVCAPVA